MSAVVIFVAGFALGVLVQTAYCIRVIRRMGRKGTSNAPEGGV